MLPGAEAGGDGRLIEDRPLQTALFQHFTFPEIIRHQIGRTRGDISSQENLLGQLATQFGEATGERGALRDAIGTFDNTRSVRPEQGCRI
jgi:hypothetical protein